MFEKILIANRGEVAVRIIRACKEMGVKTVAIYSTADATALHVTLADEAYCIGGPRASESYLNTNAIITVALESGASAIHPGYGFLSENASFARECREHGLVFIGPSPEIMELMGDKDQARRTARSAGVPIVPGCDLLESSAQAEEEARRIGCPVLVKARAGGGGRGIRKVLKPEDAPAAFEQAHAEAQSAFGDGECYMEKFISPAHHIEVQILADGHGNVFSLVSYRFYATNVDLAIANCYQVGCSVYPDQFADVDPTKKLDEITDFFLGKGLSVDLAAANCAFQAYDLLNL